MTTTTSTERVVVLDRALRSNTAGVGARIATLLVDAGFVRGTLSADHALGSAVGRNALVVRQA